MAIDIQLAGNIFSEIIDLAGKERRWLETWATGEIDDKRFSHEMTAIGKVLETKIKELTEILYACG